MTHQLSNVGTPSHFIFILAAAPAPTASKRKPKVLWMFRKLSFLYLQQEGVWVTDDRGGTCVCRWCLEIESVSCRSEFMCLVGSSRLANSWRLSYNLAAWICESPLAWQERDLESYLYEVDWYSELRIALVLPSSPVSPTPVLVAGTSGWMTWLTTKSFTAVFGRCGSTGEEAMDL